MERIKLAAAYYKILKNHCRYKNGKVAHWYNYATSAWIMAGCTYGPEDL